MNKVIVHGRLTRDPEVKNTEKSSVCTFTIAENQRFNRDLCNFHDCEAWGKSGEFVAQYFHKGSEILVTGELRQRKYEAKDGTPRAAWSINVDATDFCGKATDNANQTNKPAAESGATAQFQTPAFTAPKFEEIKSDDELPF